MTIEQYKEQLSQLHNSIKTNIFRKDYDLYIKYGTGYFDTMYKFAELFYHLTKDIQRNIINNISVEDSKLSKVADDCLFIHDFYGSINRCSNAIISNSIDIIHKEEQFIELCITCIHTYIDTGLFNRYPFKYRGKLTWVEWDNNRNEYVIKL